MDELTLCKLITQLNVDPTKERFEDQNITLDSLIRNYLFTPTTMTNPIIIPQQQQLSTDNKNLACQCDNSRCFLRDNEIINNNGEDFGVLHREAEITSPTHYVCSPVDSSRPFCQCKYKNFWLPRDRKLHQIKERSERYFNCLSMTYDLRKYYEHQFCVLGLYLFKMNIFIDDKGNLFGIIVKNSNNASIILQDFKFNLIIRNTDSNEFISYEGLALPENDKTFHFTFRIDHTMFHSYFVGRKLIRGKPFSCNLIMERSYLSLNKRYFK